MTAIQKTATLRRQLRQWAADPEWELVVRYELLPQRPAPELHRRLSQKLGRLLRIWGLSRARYLTQVWQPGLKHAFSQGTTTLLVWSDVTDQATSRAACAALQRFLAKHRRYTPVLVTHLADFAFYSRLGWLVEYLPQLPGAGPEYAERKRRYLAWRYRDAVAVPLSAAMDGEEELARLVPS